MFQNLSDLLQQYQYLLPWMGMISLLMIVGSILMLPWLISQIPADYFAHDHRIPPQWKEAHPIIRISVLVIKNLLGWMILIAGLMMLVLPGQGLLSILIALILLDYPGKFQFERWVISRPTLLHAVNRLRVKWGKPELILEEIG